MRRILLFVVPALSSALLQGSVLLGDFAKWLLLFFGVRRDGPDESEQFPPQCGHDLILVFAADRKSLVAFVQSLLRLPRHLLDLIAERQIFLPPQKKTCHVRTVLPL